MNKAEILHDIAMMLQEKGIKTRFQKNNPEHTDKGRRLIAELAQSLSVRGIAQLLRHGDRNSMCFSLESRVPFLTLDMVSLLLSLPEEYLISPQGQTKYIFRKAMRGIVPDDVLNRKEKIGFATPEQDWLLGMNNTITEWLRADLRLPFLDQTKVMQEFNQIATGKKKFTWQVWRWICFARWYQNFMGMS